MLFELADRTQLEFRGKDRAKFLHGLCTNDILGLSPGRGCEAFACNVQGKVLGHFAVFCAEDALWIDTVPGQEDALVAHFDRYLINEDVRIHRRSDERSDLFLIGDSAARSLEAVGCAAIARLQTEPVLSHVSCLLNGAEAQVRSVDWLGEPGWMVSLPRSSGDAVERRFADAGETPSNRETWNALRIEAGFPWYGVDLTSENLAQEANRTERCISFRKGCYLGQEPIARIDALGHVNRELCRVEISGNAVPPAGTPLVDPVKQFPAGVITSAARSARTAQHVFGIARVRTQFHAPGTVLSASWSSSQAGVGAEVCVC